MTVIGDSGPGVDRRARDAVVDADPPVAELWSLTGELAGPALPSMSLAAGERPAADVEVLCSAVAVVEYELARRMHAAATAGSLPLVGPGAIPAARGWSSSWARRLTRTGVFAARFPELGSVWAAGVITSEHVAALARYDDVLSGAQMAAVIDELSPLWGQLSPRAVSTFAARVVRMLHPPPDPEPDEQAAHEGRFLSFALLGDSVLVSGSLPRVEGEAVIAAIEAFADRLRSTADHVPASARRADGLMALVNAAHAADRIPSRGGLPASISVTVATTSAGDQMWTTSRGHTLTRGEQRFTACDALLTPILVTTDADPCPPMAGGWLLATAADAVDVTDGPPATGRDAPTGPPGPAERITALARSLLGTRVPLAVGRTARTASPAQRRALAARDHGCVIPGCGTPAEACQTHHVRDWAGGGRSDLDNLVLLCWAHHRQVDLGMWTISPAPGGARIPPPGTGCPPGTPWPADQGAPWIITRTPRTNWRP